MNFQFATATQIIFAPGSVQQAADLIKPLGQHVFAVVGSKPTRAQGLLDQLIQAGIHCEVFSITGEPTITAVATAAQAAKEAKAEVVVALGGGSVIDAAKAVAALLTNPGDMMDYLEVVGKGLPLKQQPAPFIAIPTTAGTGAEVTRNAVLSVPEHQRKVSMRHVSMLADIAIIDPELTYSMPPEVTANTGLDALTQVIEPFVSAYANPLTDSLCRTGILHAARSLKRAYEHGQDHEARQGMALTSLLGGLALANAKLGVVHGFAGPLGGQWHAPHGTICGRLLPYAVEANIKAVSERAPGSDYCQRFDELGVLFTGNPGARAQDAVSWLHCLCEDLGTQGLGEFGFTEADIAPLAQKAGSSSSMKGNPIELTQAELEWILRQAL